MSSSNGDQSERNLARIATHYGNALYRDGDYSESTEVFISRRRAG